MKNLTLKLCFIALLFTSASAYCQVPKLNSIASGTPSTIFLDFDGHTVQSGAWQSGTPFICAPAALSTAQITEIFNRVSEDYRPFNVNITTDSAIFLAAPITKRVRIIVTPTSAWYPGAGGVAYTGSFTWGDDTPAFVFSDKLANSSKYVAECCTHESGHTLGLAHQSKYDVNCTLTEAYRTGSGTGETAWSPVMGNSYYRNMTGWDIGPTPYNCSVPQDNLTILTTQNGFTYRTDDFAETRDNNTTLINAGAFSIGGIITTPLDKDAFKINIPQAGYIHIEVSPYSIDAGNKGANLDAMLLLYNNSNVLIGTYNPLNIMNAVVDTTLNAGNYYIVVAGAGNNNTTNYGSLGSYTLSGFRGTLPIHNVSLQGSNEKGLHKLTWQVIADEQVATQVLEASSNGSDFHSITTDVTGANKYTYAPSEKGTVFYRLKVTSVIGQSMYSNIAVIKGNNGADKLFTVSTLVQNNIVVNALENFNYNLLDANGRLIATGNKIKGNSNINVQNLSKGLYVLQMINNNYKQTERIIKQ